MVNIPKGHNNLWGNAQIQQIFIMQNDIFYLVIFTNEIFNTIKVSFLFAKKTRKILNILCLIVAMHMWKAES